MIVHLPATPADLRVLHETGRADLLEGWAVTEALRAVDPGLGEEDLEYHATYSAADASRTMVGASGRRVVIVAEAEVAQTDVPEAGRVRLAAPVEVAGVEAVFVDETPGADDDESLAWYDRSELPALARLAHPR